MPGLTLQEYGGMLPAWDASLLPTGQAAYAKNGFLFSGSLIGWRKPKFLRSLTNSAARMVYRIPTVNHMQARAYLAFLLNPLDGDTVTIGNTVYTFRNTLVSLDPEPGFGLPFEVLIGPDTYTSAGNLRDAITADAGTNRNAGIEYGTSTPLNGDVNYFLPDTPLPPDLTDPQIGQSDFGWYLEIGATDFGAAFNMIPVEESTSAVRTKWVLDPFDWSTSATTFTGGMDQRVNSGIADSSTWLEFEDPDTDVVKSPIVDDQYDRYYFASPTKPPQYNTRERIEQSQPAWLLGVPPPGCAPAVAVTGGGNNLILGNTTQTGAGVTILANYVYLTRVYVTGATVSRDVKFNIGPSFAPEDPGYPAANFAAILYEDNNGQPGLLLNTGAITAGIVANDTNSSTFVNPTDLNAFQYYWIGIICDTSVELMGGPADGSGTHVAFPATFTNGPPGDATGLAGTGLQINMWGDFTTDDVLESRAYVYTWVTQYGEESPPSPAGILTGWSNGVWTVDLFQPTTSELGVTRNLKTLNLYRTVPGQRGETVFFFVKAMDIATAQFKDDIASSVVALNDQLQSTNWFPPPTNLQGMTVIQNGMIAGFVNNAIWFSEPYRPHAWPPGYVLTVDYPVVGLGLTGGTLVVCTLATPYVINGVSPQQMSQVKCSTSQPCLSRRSILGGDRVVTYMSPNGLIQVDGNGVVDNTTDRWITRQKWQQLVPQNFARAISLMSSYYCLGSVSPSLADTTVAKQGFTIELAQDNTGFSIWPVPGGHRLGLQILDAPLDTNVLNLLTDPWTGIGLLVTNGAVYYYDFADLAPELKSYQWLSRDHQQNAKRNFAATKVFFKVPPGTPTLNPTRLTAAASSSVWDTLPADRYAFIKTYVEIDGDGSFRLIDCREVRKSGEVLRIVDGFKADRWRFEILGRIEISNVQIATSVKALAQS